jgi:hypothetical protein
MALLRLVILLVVLLSSLLHGQDPLPAQEVPFMYKEGESDFAIPTFRFGRDLRIMNFLDPLFFCAHVPNGYFNPKHELRPRRRSTPGSNFWQFEPQFTHWNTRFRSEGHRYGRGPNSAQLTWDIWKKHGLWREPQSTAENDRFQDEMQYQVMDRGLYFNTEVTAIKDKIGADGKILKGWFHLKVTLERMPGAVSKSPFVKDASATGPQEGGAPIDKEVDFLIDRLVISARGLTIAEGNRPAKPGFNLHANEPVLAYTSGVGQFVLL